MRPGTTPTVPSTPIQNQGNTGATVPPYIYGTAPNSSTRTPQRINGNAPTTPPSRTPGMQPGMNNGMQNMIPGMQPDMNNGMQNMTPGMQPNMNNGMQNMTPGMQPGMNNGMQNMTPGMQPGMNNGMQNMTPGMQPNMNGMQPIAYPEYQYYYNQNGPSNYPLYQGAPNMYLPNANSYAAPMGVPMLPLYGYDNSMDLDRDVEYMKQLYPRTAKSIQSEIDDECDKMEYDGSMMFDEYPDKTYLDKIIDRIYDKVRTIEEEPQVEINSLYFFPPRHQQNHLRDIINIILLNEIFNRRRRHRSRRRWF
jgi:hypothetical protein